jgi:hypothetical protein
VDRIEIKRIDEPLRSIYDQFIALMHLPSMRIAGMPPPSSPSIISGMEQKQAFIDFLGQIGIAPPQSLVSGIAAPGPRSLPLPHPHPPATSAAAVSSPNDSNVPAQIIQHASPSPLPRLSTNRSNMPPPAPPSSPHQASIRPQSSLPPFSSASIGGIAAASTPKPSPSSILSSKRMGTRSGIVASQLQPQTKPQHNDGSSRVHSPFHSSLDTTTSGMGRSPLSHVNASSSFLPTPRPMASQSAINNKPFALQRNANVSSSQVLMSSIGKNSNDGDHSGNNNNGASLQVSMLPRLSTSPSSSQVSSLPSSTIAMVRSSSASRLQQFRFDPNNNTSTTTTGAASTTPNRVGGHSVGIDNDVNERINKGNNNEEVEIHQRQLNNVERAPFHHPLSLSPSY